MGSELIVDGGDPSRAYLAVDIGGTKIEVGVVSDQRIVMHRSRLRTPRHDVWSAVAAAVESCQTWATARAVSLVSCGVGCGGPMNLARKTVSPLHIEEWRRYALESALRELTGLPVIVDNDAKALVRAEWWHRRESRGVEVPRAMMSIVLGTGLGAGIIVGDRLLHGRTGNAGHIGHVIVEPDGPRCECGARGCLEALASGRALTRVTNGGPEAATAGQRADVGRWLGIAIASVAATVDLVDVTLGGSVALGFGESVCAIAQHFAREHAGLSTISDITVGLVADRNDAPLFGAAALAKYPSPYETDVFDRG